MDGFVFYTRLKEVDGELRTIDVNLDGEKEPSKLALKCVEEFKKRTMPLNEGETFINSFRGNILGGEMDGISGILSHPREKSARVMNKTAAMLCMPDTNQA